MPKQVLVVEDEAIVALDIRHRLESLGYTVMATVARGSDAIAIVEKTYPDLILMDIQIQGDMDGIETATIIQERADVPVIFLTANSDEATLQRAKGSAPMAFLLKPFEDRDLRTAIEIALHRHQQDRLIRQLERRWENTLTSIGDAVIATDCEGLITYMNPVAESVSCFSVKEGLGKPIEDVMALSREETGEEIENPVYGVLRTKDRVDLANGVRLRQPDGTFVPIEDCATPIVDDAGNLDGVVLVFRDVTERRLREKELVAYRENLEELVAKRTIQLERKKRELEDEIAVRKAAEQERFKLQEELAKSERMRSLALLAGGVAHDLNNMLGPMIAYPDLIMERLPVDSSIKTYLIAIKKSATNAKNTVQDLLTLARRGRHDLEPLDLNGVISDYLSGGVFQSIIKDRNDIKVETSVDSTSAVVNGSATQLNKVVMNLCGNAIEAMPDGGTISITTSVEYLEALFGGYDRISPGHYAILRIRDTGIGIPDEDIPRLFEPYFSKKELGRSGTGLGLSVVYGVVKDHDGFYDVFSTVGKGSEFVIYLPVCGKSVEHADCEVMQTKKSAKILVVDDSPEQREMAVELVSALGYDVESVSSGREAVKWLKENNADVLLLDMKMEPDFDGLDTYMEIRKFRQNQRAIIVSGYAATDRVKRMQELGAGEYVSKPYTLADISRAICNELRRVPVSENA